MWRGRAPPVWFFVAIKSPKFCCCFFCFLSALFARSFPHSRYFVQCTPFSRDKSQAKAKADAQDAKDMQN